MNNDKERSTNDQDLAKVGTALRRPKQAIVPVVDTGQRSRWPQQPAQASRVLLECLCQGLDPVDRQ